MFPCLGIGLPRRGVCGSVLLPFPGYLAWLSGGVEAGTTATVNDKVGTVDDLLYVNSNCKLFDGVGDKLSITGLDPSALSVSALEYEILFYFTPSSHANEVLMGIGWRQGSGTQSMILGFDVSSRIQATASVGSGAKYAGPITISTEGWHTAKCSYDGSTLRLYLDGSLIASNTTDLSGALIQCTGYKFKIGVIGNEASQDNYFSGKISYAKATNASGVLFGYTFASGPSATEYDISGNGNHGTYTTGAGGIVGMATQEATGQIVPWNMVNGFSLYTHATLANLRIPYSNGSPLSITPPSGYSLDSEHPAGFFHNGAEVLILPPSGVGLGNGEEMEVPTFDSPPFWTLGTGWSIPAVDSLINTTTAMSTATSAYFTPVAGANYLVIVEFAQNSLDGTQISLGGDSFVAETSGSSGIVKAVLTTVNTDGISIYNISTPCEITSISIRRVLTYSELLALAQAADGTNNWEYSYDDNANVVDGLYYNPALTGADATELLNFLNGRHS